MYYYIHDVNRPFVLHTYKYLTLNNVTQCHYCLFRHAVSVFGSLRTIFPKFRIPTQSWRRANKKGKIEMLCQAFFSLPNEMNRFLQETILLSMEFRERKSWRREMLQETVGIANQPSRKCLACHRTF